MSALEWLAPHKSREDRMTTIASVGTYLPPWQQGARRIKGPDEDTLTMAVAAGRAADPKATASQVVFVSRSFPLLEGGNGAVLLAGLSLPADTPVTEVLGAAPAMLDQLGSAPPGTLVVGADDVDSADGAGAVLIGSGGDGAAIQPVTRRIGSLPTLVRTDDGSRHEYVDPRLQREVGIVSTAEALILPDAIGVVGVVGASAAVLARRFDTSAALTQSSSTAAAVIRMIADVLAAGKSGWTVAIEQSTAVVADLSCADTAATIGRDERPARELPATAVAPGTGIPISLPAYARAFEPKLRWQAAIFDERPGIDATPVFPPRMRVDRAGALVSDYRYEPLPRTGAVYTQTTVRIPVPDLPSPYSLAVVQLDDSPVRVLLKITGVPAGEAAIGQTGSIVLRKIATRAGIPDYGYAFWPNRHDEPARVSP
jgi:uncharacterized OB-fold protein